MYTKQVKNTKNILNISNIYWLPVFLFVLALVTIGLIFPKSARADTCVTPLSADQFEQAFNSGQIVVSGGNVDNNLNKSSVTVTNNTNCPAQVSFSSYGMYVAWPNLGWLNTQQFFNGTGLVTVQAGETKTLMINTPNCKTQVDLLFVLYQTTLFDNKAYAYPSVPFDFGYDTYSDSNKDLCSVPPPPPPIPATLHIIKTVINDNGGIAVASAFNLHVKFSGADVAGSPAAGTVSPGTSYTLAPGAYIVSEDANASYNGSFSGDCDASGNVTLASGDNKTCTLTNDDIAPPSPGCVGSCGGPMPPAIHVVKTANPTSLNVSGLVTYSYAVSNKGTMAMSNITIKDDKCSPVNFVSGDTNGDLKLDTNEIWNYSCVTTLSQTTTNTVVVTGQANGSTVTDTANATVVVTTPGFPNTGTTLIHITKVPNPSTLPILGGMVTYTYTVTNPGNNPLSNVTVNDDKCEPANYVSGDSNVDFKLDPSETWIFTCRTNLTKTTTNIAVASGEVNGITVTDSATAIVTVPIPGFPRTGFSPFAENSPWNILVLFGDIIVVGMAFIIIFKKRAL